jgi:murein DD-endopeptidase MepM/ murein hydrolase activator NlpD
MLTHRPSSEAHAPHTLHQGPTLSDGSGWASTPRPRRRPTGRRLLSLALLLPFVFGLLGAPATTSPVQGDELSDTRAKLAQQKKEIAEQKKQVKELEALQNGLVAEIASTRRQLAGINADLKAVKRKINKMVDRIGVVQSKYDGLVSELGRLDRQLLFLTSRERVMKEELRIRQGMLADRIRNAYDTDRTSLLESMLSGDTFTDMLTQMSYFLDVGEQDKALAEQIARDQEALLALHETVETTRDRTDSLRLETAAQKRKLDASLKGLKAAKADLRRLEKETERNLRAQRSMYAKVQANQKNAKKALAAAAAAQKRLAGKIAAIVAKQTQSGNIPSEYNGTLRWPMSGSVTQDFGCTGFSWEPPLGSCDHFHRGIDIVAPSGTKVRSSGDGVVAYIGWNYADGADPAWIVIIAHSSGLQTWYAHLKAKYPPGIRQGAHVRAGQVIGYEGNTGHSTGAHLHWAVMFNGDFVNPRLFL